MKTKKILTLLLLSVVGIICIHASETVSTQDKLTGVQKRTLEYTKNLLKDYNNDLFLPLEINFLIGDTISKDRYKVKPQLDELTFHDLEGYTSYVKVCLRAVNNNDTIESVLHVASDKESNYYRVIETILSMQENENVNIIVNSNLDGVFLQAKIFSNGEIIKTIDGIAKDFGIEDSNNSRLKGNRKWYVNNKSKKNKNQIESEKAVYKDFRTLQIRSNGIDAPIQKMGK